MWECMSHVVIIAMLKTAVQQHQLGGKCKSLQAECIHACTAYTKRMASSAQTIALAYTSDAVCFHCAFFAVDQLLPGSTPA